MKIKYRQDSVCVYKRAKCYRNRKLILYIAQKSWIHSVLLLFNIQLDSVISINTYSFLLLSLPLDLPINFSLVLLHISWSPFLLLLLFSLQKFSLWQRKERHHRDKRREIAQYCCSAQEALWWSLQVAPGGLNLDPHVR